MNKWQDFLFQLTAARRRLAHIRQRHTVFAQVSTHSRPKAAGHDLFALLVKFLVSTHSRPKAAGGHCGAGCVFGCVSTHSRPKAAGLDIAVLNGQRQFQLTAARRRLALPPKKAWTMSCFNSQPPEGGWGLYRRAGAGYLGFNSQPPEGGWQCCGHTQSRRRGFNSQPPEGGWKALQHTLEITPVSTHSRPKAAGQTAGYPQEFGWVSTHSRPKAAGEAEYLRQFLCMFQLTAARRRLGHHLAGCPAPGSFQLTAARRRLAITLSCESGGDVVSTHSRPKAAGWFGSAFRCVVRRFNSQPPEGGWGRHE